VFKDFFNYFWLVCLCVFARRQVDKTDDAHLSMAFGAGQRVCFIDLSDEV